ncbi:MAG: hypothetical protein IIZ93_14835 [Acidaminococcaceae bacterium]|nr:hypothetical protein [Acidaminococcaceae bacterium]
MKVTVFYEKNKKPCRKTMSLPNREWLCAFDFEEIKNRLQRGCSWGDTIVMRKIRVGNEEYMGLW